MRIKSTIYWQIMKSQVSIQYVGESQFLIYGHKFLFLWNSPTCCLKSIPKPFLTKLNGLRAIVPHTFFFHSQLFDYLRWFFAKCMNPWWKKLCPREGPNMLTISYSRDFSQSKNSGRCVALSRQKRLYHTWKPSQKHVFRDLRE